MRLSTRNILLFLAFLPLPCTRKANNHACCKNNELAHTYTTHYTIQVVVFWFVTLCSVMVWYQYFRGPCCLSSGWRSQWQEVDLHVGRGSRGDRDVQANKKMGEGCPWKGQCMGEEISVRHSYECGARPWGEKIYGMVESKGNKSLFLTEGLQNLSGRLPWLA
jgi:hypothetical protein